MAQHKGFASKVLPTIGFALAAFSGAADSTVAQTVQGSSPFSPWNNGLHDEPEMQVQQYDSDTFIIRQSVRTNFEAPFIFLFFGPERVLQIDSGAGGLKIRPTVDKVISDWAASKGIPEPPLVVAHSHAHGDHLAGDTEYADRPNTTVVGHSPEAVASFFHIQRWPEDTASLELGGREVDIIPMPGHEVAEIAVFDRRTHLLPCRNSTSSTYLRMAIASQPIQSMSVVWLFATSQSRGSGVRHTVVLAMSHCSVRGGLEGRRHCFTPGADQPCAER